MRLQPGKCSSAGASSSGKPPTCGGSRSCPCLADEFPPLQEAHLVSAAASLPSWESPVLSRESDRGGHTASTPVGQLRVHHNRGFIAIRIGVYASHCIVADSIVDEQFDVVAPLVPGA